MPSLAKDIRALVAEAERQGATIRVGRRMHYKVRCPNGQTVTISATPSHRGALRSIRRDLRVVGGLDF